MKYTNCVKFVGFDSATAFVKKKQISFSDIIPGWTGSF